MTAKHHNHETTDQAAVENPAAVPAAGDPPAAADVTSLADQIAKLLAEKNELTETLIRRQADFENYRKRVERERQTEHHRGIEGLIESLLPVLDGFERALAAHADPGYENYRKGFELIYRQLENILSKKGLEQIDAEGKPFDPNLHHAVERIESTDYPDGTVVGVLQAGYMFHGKVLRPAMVRVTANAGQQTSQPN
ncbi:MAG TPA: nucleotide exchange factor GrpE [Candidatus Acidoferrales bacterium]|nr:nucleotide exchange factor GrpE [Candidatus Acidoferrales bacterium]